jgi:16S rRNA (adenine1518-N6/adenine1519-N6)-dimethyltransferase
MNKPKKSLGQNFLTSEAAVFKIVDAAQISAGENVLEVGPGRGVLTQALLAAGAHVVAIEKDKELIAPLSEKFSAEILSGNFKIIESDILEVDLEKDLGYKPREFKIVANLPYYITGEFLRKFLSGDAQPRSMVLLLQKEVVERIIAADKKESILSMSIKAYGDPRKITVVNRGSFFPAPNVDSAVISIENISKNNFIDAGFENPASAEEKFFEIVRAGFAHKRKLLVSNLSSIFDKEKIHLVFTELSIPEKIRAEDLSLKQWLEITKKLVS